jgi:parallel beta-helix repeat protein
MKLSGGYIGGVMLMLILVGMLTFSFNVCPAKAAGVPIVISPSGSVTPVGAPIINFSKEYYLVIDDVFDTTIVIARSNITLDGNGHTLQGVGTGSGINITASQYLPTSASNVTIQNINIKNFTRGVCFNSTSYNQVLRSNITDNYEGIRIGSSHHNTFSRNNLASNSRGLWFDRSATNTVNENNITDNVDLAVVLSESNYNTVSDNYITASSICLMGSSNNIISGNNITRGGISLGSYSNNNVLTANTLIYNGLMIDNSFDNSVENNTVNGKPILCLEGISDYVAEKNVGQVLFVKCNRIRVENLSISNVDFPMMLEKTNNTIIKGNNITESAYGMWISSSLNISIVGNHIANCGECIEIEGSPGGNFVSGNTLINSSCGVGIVGFSVFDRILPFRSTLVCNNIANNVNGLVVWFALNWGIIENNITGSTERGIWISQGIRDNQTSNCYYHNNVINNTEQIFFQYKSTYAWDNGFLEGNYWSDYNGTDSDGDGIGDTPKILNSINSDKYPLMKPYVRGDYNHDGTVNMTDADMVKEAWQSRKPEANYNSHADFNMNNMINIADAAMIGANWQKHA